MGKDSLSSSPHTGQEQTSCEPVNNPIKAGQRQQHLVDLIDSLAIDEFLELVNDGSSSTLRDFERTELVLRACRFGSLELVRSFVTDDDLIKCRHSSTGYSPLFIAIRGRQRTIIDYIISRHPPIDFSACLHEAIRQQDPVTVKLFLQLLTPDVLKRHHFLSALCECIHESESNIDNQNKGRSLDVFNSIIAHRPDLVVEYGKCGLNRIRGHLACLPSTCRAFLQPVLDQLGDDGIRSLSLTSCVHRTQVAIVGGGPAGLVLGALLAREGIDSVVLEQQSRSRVESTIRAGMLEQTMVDQLDDLGVGNLLLRNGIIQRCIFFQFEKKRICLPVEELTRGKVLTIYGQERVLTDLIRARVQSGQRLWFNIEHVQIERHGDEQDIKPLLKFRRAGHEKDEQLECDFIVGCDGAASRCCRQSIPDGILHTIRQTFPFAWLSVLADAPPRDTQMIFAFHPQRGFAIHTLRSMTRTRLHLQIPLGDTIEQWPDQRIWAELRSRLASDDNDWQLNEGPILERAIFPIRALVTTPMQYKRLFLVGDNVHITMPTGAKGMNLAMADACVLARAFVEYYDHGGEKWVDALSNYTAQCLPHIWDAQEFSTFLTRLMHLFPSSGDDNHQNRFDQHLQEARQKMICTSVELQRFIVNKFVNGT